MIFDRNIFIWVKHSKIHWLRSSNKGFQYYNTTTTILAEDSRIDKLCYQKNECKIERPNVYLTAQLIVPEIKPSEVDQLSKTRRDLAWRIFIPNEIYQTQQRNSEMKSAYYKKGGKKTRNEIQRREPRGRERERLRGRHR